MMTMNTWMIERLCEESLARDRAGDKELAQLLMSASLQLQRMDYKLGLIHMALGEDEEE